MDDVAKMRSLLARVVLETPYKERTVGICEDILPLFAKSDCSVCHGRGKWYDFQPGWPGWYNSCSCVEETVKTIVKEDELQ